MQISSKRNLLSRCAITVRVTLMRATAECSRAGCIRMTQSRITVSATAAAIFLARTGSSKGEIKQYIENNFYPLDTPLDEIRPNYSFHETCRQTVPQAIRAFLESTDFEDAVRNAVSLGGDSDTLAAITGSIALAFYDNLPAQQEKNKKLVKTAARFLPSEFLVISQEFDRLKKLALSGEK